MKLYTKTGDDGSTGLLGGGRVRKDDLRVAAYGDVDETNSTVGFAAAACDDDGLTDTLRQIQSDLFTLGAELAVQDAKEPSLRIAKERADQLEQWIDEATATTAPLKAFVLPGGCELAARLHLARSVCRRAERSVVTLGEKHTVSRNARVYLNRLSDLLFALARAANRKAGVPDIPWSTDIAQTGDAPSA